MSIIRKAVIALIAVSVLAFQSVSHAEALEEKQVGQPGIAGVVIESAKDTLSSIVTTITTPVINVKELQCLARNIFYEAANEPEEGKVAVGLVTLNRLQDGRFGNSICGVVNQRTVFRVPKQITVKREGWFTTKTETQTVYVDKAICQFSWRCEGTRPVKKDDDRWIESQRIARELLEDQDNHSMFRARYADALYFHATHIRPAWAHQKSLVNRVGGHRFYKERQIAMR